MSEARATIPACRILPRHGNGDTRQMRCFGNMIAIETRLARSRTPSPQQRQALRARREPGRRRKPHLASRDDDARLGAAGAARLPSRITDGLVRISTLGIEDHRRDLKDDLSQALDARSSPRDHFAINFVLHFDKHLLEFIRLYGAWVYAILFTIVFAETGFVVTPIPARAIQLPHRTTSAVCATGGVAQYPVRRSACSHVRRLYAGKQYRELRRRPLPRPARLQRGRHRRASRHPRCSTRRI